MSTSGQKPVERRKGQGRMQSFQVRPRKNVSELMRCEVWCGANYMIYKSQNGLQSRVDGFDSRPRFQHICRSARPR